MKEILSNKMIYLVYNKLSNIIDILKFLKIKIKKLYYLF